MLPDDFTLEQGGDSAKLSYAVDGAIVTMYQVDPSSNEFIAIGRAPVVDGRATIEFFQNPLPGVELILSISAENAVSLYLVSGQTGITAGTAPGVIQ
jgi:hypothetical protein